MAQMWARVKDKITGHHYDVGVERMFLLVERGAVTEIPGGRHYGKPRRAKPQRPLATLVPQSKRAAKPAVAETKESESL